MASGIRPSAVAGSFYPDEKNRLQSRLADFFASAKNLTPKGKTVKALIVPHAGYIYSGATAAKGYAQLPKNLDNPHFVLIGPSHHSGLSQLTGSSAAIWQTPLGPVTQVPAPPTDDDVHQSEHCLEVQLPFLQHLYRRFSVTCLLTGFLPELKSVSRDLLTNYPSAVFVISSDLSHYLSLAQAQVRDQKTVEAVLEDDSGYFYGEDNHACGATGILLVMEMARAGNWHPRLICYDTSATASGDSSAVVGYAALAYYA